MSGAVDKTRVPKLRFPEFEGSLSLDWRPARLADVATMYSGGTPPAASPDLYGGNIPFIKSGEIGSPSVDQYLTESGMQASSAKMVEQGDLLYALYGATSGEVALSKLRGAINQAVLCIRPAGSKRFLAYWLEKQKGRLRSTYLQGGQGNFSAEIVKNLVVAFPNVDEQEKVAESISHIDERLSLLEQRRRALEAYKKGTIQRLFSQELRFTRDDGSPFPDWQVKRLGEVFERVTRRNTAGNLNVLTISAQLGLINQREFFNKSVSANDVTGYYLLQRGDFAYNKSYSNGYPLGAIKRLKRYDAGVVSTLYICFRSRNEREVPFYEHYFDGGGLNREIHKIAQEGARNHGLLNMSVVEFFRDIQIPRPHPNEQQKIANFLSTLDAKIDEVARQIAAMQRFKKGLLQQMFV